MLQFLLLFARLEIRLTFCHYQLLQRQRFFAFVLPRVVEGHSNSVGAPQKSLYLIALSSLLPFLPAQTISEQLGPLFPLLIQALDLPDPKARASAANAITIATEIGKRARDTKASSAAFDPSKLVIEHLATIIKRLLANSRVGPFAIPVSFIASEPVYLQKLESMMLTRLQSTRIASLRTLSSLATSLPPQSLVPYRQLILRSLAEDNVAIDDPKRHVRSYGVDCRDAWFAVPDRDQDE